MRRLLQGVPATPSLIPTVTQAMLSDAAPIEGEDFTQHELLQTVAVALKEIPTKQRVPSPLLGQFLSSRKPREAPIKRRRLVRLLQPCTMLAAMQFS